MFRTRFSDLQGLEAGVRRSPRGARLTALENRASNLLRDDQNRKAFEKGHKDRYSNSLLGGVPLSPTRFSTQES